MDKKTNQVKGIEYVQLNFSSSTTSLCIKHRMDYLIFFTVTFILLAFVHFDQRGKRTWFGKKVGSDVKRINIPQGKFCKARLKIQSFPGLIHKKVVSIEINDGFPFSFDTEEFDIKPEEAKELANCILEKKSFKFLPHTTLTDQQASEIADALQYAASHA